MLHDTSTDIDRLISLSFISPLQLYESEKPYAFDEVVSNVPEAAQSNLRFTLHDDIPIVDVRNLPAMALSYEQQGFKFLSHPTSSTYHFSSDSPSVEVYCQQMIKLVSEQFGAEKTVCYDLRLRRNNTPAELYKKSLDKSRMVFAPPVHGVHIDHSKLSGLNRACRHLAALEANEYLSGGYRVQIINVWRPLYRPVEDCPLAICDASTISEKDLLAADRVASDFVFELYYVKHSTQQKWYWLSGQTPDEVLVFVQFDSEAAKTEGQVLACPHAAFNDQHARHNVPNRESVEVRLIVFTKINQW